MPNNPTPLSSLPFIPSLVPHLPGCLDWSSLLTGPTGVSVRPPPPPGHRLAFEAEGQEGDTRQAWWGSSPALPCGGMQGSRGLSPRLLGWHHFSYGGRCLGGGGVGITGDGGGGGSHMCTSQSWLKAHLTTIATCYRYVAAEGYNVE